MKTLVEAAFESMMQAKLKRALKRIHERLRIAQAAERAMEPPHASDDEDDGAEARHIPA